jgi:UPF0755 protein
VSAVGVFYWLDQAGSRAVTTEQRVVTVPSGATMRSFATQMVNEGYIDEPWALRIWARYLGLESALKTGEYSIEAGTSLQQLLETVTSGDVIDYPVTFIEGWTFAQVLEELSKKEKLKQLVSNLDDAAIMKMLGAEDLHPEGRFFPDTYHYTASMSDLDILRQAFKKMRDFLSAEWAGRAPDLPLRSPDEALILASIIEKETGDPTERAMISGVFVNRLRKGMRLQTDPTVIYGMGDEYDGNIRKKDLRTDTPYNTYTRSGLTPTPIAMPGGDSIHAALHPADTNALYFVSRGDGTHYFSTTLSEHNEAVIKYQLGGKRKNFSSYNQDKQKQEEK